jgi:hypothetical protein
MGVSGHLRPRPLYTQERTLVPLEKEAARAAELFWTFWRIEKSLDPRNAYIVVCFRGSAAQSRAMASSFTRFLDHTQRRATVGRTFLDE